MIISPELDGLRRQVEDCIASAYTKGYKRGVADVRGELVRCKDCKWHDKKYFCINTGTWGWDDNDYCSAVEREEDT